MSLEAYRDPNDSEHRLRCPHCYKALERRHGPLIAYVGSCWHCQQVIHSQRYARQQASLGDGDVFLVVPSPLALE